MIQHWNVSPRIGLNGFYMQRYRIEFEIPQPTTLSSLFIAFYFYNFSRKIGAYDIPYRNLSRLLSTEKISTGRLMVVGDCPDKIFLAIFLKTKDKTPFWSSVLGLLTNSNPPSLSLCYQSSYQIGWMPFDLSILFNLLPTIGSVI